MTVEADATLPPVHVRISQMALLVDTAAMAGVDTDALFRSLKMPPLSTDAQATMPLGDYFRLQNEISAALKDETLHLSTRQLLPGTTDYVLSHLVGVKSLFEAMKILAQSYNLLHGGQYNSVRRKGDIISFVIDDRRFPYTQTDNQTFLRFSLECVQIILHCMLASVSRPHAQAGLRRVSVTRDERATEAIHLDFWRAPIRFGAPVYALDYDFETATAAIDAPRIDRLNAARVHAEILAASATSRGAGQGGDTADLVRQMLARGVIDQTRIAALAGISAATLRRRLDSEGITFRDLRSDVLNAAAKKLLRSRSSIPEVAEELGFSDVRAFNRAFRAWNGVSPRAFADAATTKAK